MTTVFACPSKNYFEPGRIQELCPRQMVHGQKAKTSQRQKKKLLAHIILYSKLNSWNNL